MKKIAKPSMKKETKKEKASDMKQDKALFGKMINVKLKKGGKK